MAIEIQTVDPIDDARIAIVVSQYNATVTERLLAGARQALHEAGIPAGQIELARVPGAWEIPLAAQELAATGRFAAILCLGAVVRGETTHDQYINQQVSRSLGAIALEFRIPVMFGVLTCQTLEQALQRAGGESGNKGAECAQAAVQMIRLLRAMRDSTAAHAPDTAR